MITGQLKIAETERENGKERSKSGKRRRVQIK